MTYLAFIPALRTREKKEYDDTKFTRRSFPFLSLENQQSAQKQTQSSYLIETKGTKTNVLSSQRSSYYSKAAPFDIRLTYFYYPQSIKKKPLGRIGLGPDQIGANLS